MMPKRPFWLAMGTVVGAGSTLWVERRVRRTVQDAANRLQPDALAAELGRSARHMAEIASERVRDAVSTGRIEMRQHEERLWQELAERRVAPDRTEPNAGGELPTESGPGHAPPLVPMQQSAPVMPVGPDRNPGFIESPQRRSGIRIRRPKRAEATKSPSHLGN